MTTENTEKLRKNECKLDLDEDRMFFKFQSKY